jgi:shikimate kinase
LAERLPHAILVGLPGVGKSTVGRRVAKLLDRPFLDFDAELERRTGRRVSRIFAERGESYFRTLERGLTEELAGREGMVLTPGGGWVADPGNVALLRPPGRIIFLDATPETVVGRMGRGIRRRPLLARGDAVATVRRLLEQRRSSYAAADLVVDTEIMDLQQVIAAVAALVRPLWQG